MRKMSYVIKIDGVFDSLRNHNDAAAKIYAEEAKEELKILVKMQHELQGPEITALKMVINIVDNVLRDQMKSAKVELENEKMKKGYLQLQKKLKDFKQNQNIRQSEGPHEQDPGFSYSQRKQQSPSEQQVSPNMHKLAIDPNNVSGHLPTHQAEKSASQEKPSAIKEKHSALKENHSTVVSTYPEYTKLSDFDDKESSKMERNKKASKAMNMNNPDIADLSDINRPTKLAEKFSELYDNEWTEVFDILNSKIKVSEKTIIDELLLIIQDAYKFCKEEADIQIKVMFSECLKIIGGKGNNAKSELTDTDRNLMLELRKANAALALPRLETIFFDKRIKDINKKEILKGTPQPSKAGPMAKYAKKAIEVTWWMNVQIPPVYMCPTEGQFDPNLYRAYTKSGKDPVFFVWPALRLFEGGGVLVKGVVQFE